MGYDQYTFPDDCSCRTYFCCFPLTIANITSQTSRAILSNFFEEQCTQNHPQYLWGLSRALFPTTFLETAVNNRQTRIEYAQENAHITNLWVYPILSSLRNHDAHDQTKWKNMFTTQTCWYWLDQLWCITQTVLNVSRPDYKVRLLSPPFIECDCSVTINCGPGDWNLRKQRPWDQLYSTKQTY